MSDGNRRKKSSRAKRGSQKGEAPETKASGGASAEGEDRTEKTSEAETGSPGEEAGSEKPESGKKIKLPAYGMADDLLRDLAKQRAAEEADAEDGEETGAAAEADEAAAALAADDPERIYDFADRLQGRSRDREKDEEERQQLEPFVTFDLADEVFGLPVRPIREVMRISDITRVPHAPRPIRGVTNLRGRVIPVIDLRQRIGLPPAEIEKTHRIIVVAARQRLIGLLVDGVRQVVHLDVLRIQPPPDDVMTVQSDYISGIYHQERELILLLDVERSLVVKESEFGAA